MAQYHEHKFFHANRENPDRCDECGNAFMAHYNGRCPMTDDEIAADDAARRDTLHDFVVAHGLGFPTDEAYTLGLAMVAQGYDYATAAAEIVARDLLTENS